MHTLIALGWKCRLPAGDNDQPLTEQQCVGAPGGRGYNGIRGGVYGEERGAVALGGEKTHLIPLQPTLRIAIQSIESY